MLPDPWLKRWLPLVAENNDNARVLEIGCGVGDDTATLAAAGLSVSAFDISATSVAAAKLRVPTATVDQRDIRDPFPIAEGGAAVVVASLTLHYFSWVETVALVEKVRRTLQASGIFLCRLNSTDDKNFGATGHSEIEPNFYLVDGQPKRFFDEESVDQLFNNGWQILSKQHMVTRKYVQKKALWEIVSLRSDA